MADSPPSPPDSGPASPPPGSPTGVNAPPPGLATPSAPPGPRPAAAVRAKKARSWMYWPKRVLALLYLFLASWLSVWLAAHAPAGGGSIEPYLPRDHLLFLHLKNGDAAWRAIESHPGVQALWADKELQRRGGWKKKLDAARRNWARKPALVRQLLSMDRPGLRFFLGGEMAFVLQAPPPAPQPSVQQPQPERGPPPGLLFLRVQGGQGTLLRALLSLFDQENARKKKEDDAVFYDLGGGLIALGFNGAQARFHPAPGPDTAAAAAGAGGAFAELRARPREIASALEFSWLQALAGFPSWPEVFGVRRLPDEIRLFLKPGDAPPGLVAEGSWHGPLPPREEPAPLINAEPDAGAPPLLEALLPLNARAAFLRYIGEQMSSPKTRRRWLLRFSQLALKDVDLDEALWPFTGRTLRLRVLPPPPDAGLRQPLALFSLPFRARPAARRALAELARVRWKGGLHEKQRPRHARYPLVLRFTKGPLERYVLLKSKGLNFSAPSWLVSPRGLAFTSNAGPYALTPMAPGLAPPKPRPEGARERPVFFLRGDGARLAPYVSALVQKELQRYRDRVGAAKYMEQVPDEGAVLAMARKLSRFAGKLSVALHGAAKAEKSERGHISARWRPAVRIAP